MSDVVSIELVLDAATDAAVRCEWRALADAGFSSLAAHTAASNRPHVTLLAGAGLPALDLADAFRLPTPVTLGAPVLFGSGDRRVLARAVVPTAEILDLHRVVHESAAGFELAPFSSPGEWMPHVSLARRLKLTDVPAALELIGGDVDGHFVEARRWDAATKTITVVG